MLNALRALRRNGSPANLRGWLLTIAHNEAVSLMRRSRPSEPLDHGHGGAGPGADEGAFARERLRQLVDDLNALPDRQRGALLLREASGYSYRRIASALGTSTGNARQTVHQARRNLHKRRVGREHGWLGWALPGLAGAWLLRALGLEELAANSLNAGKAALLAGALVVGGGAASQVAGGGALLGAATPSALASAPPPHALAALPRRLGQAREAPAIGAKWAGGSDEAPPEPLDAAIIFAPVGPLVPAALRALDRGGVVVCAGIHMSDIPGFPYSELWEERTIRSVANLTRQDGIDFLNLAPQVPVRTTVTEYDLENANTALDDLRRGRLEGSAVIMPPA